MTRAEYLATRTLVLVRTLGDGPWATATRSRMMAALGEKRPALPWFADPQDFTPESVAWERESGHAGYRNRHQRKRERYLRHWLVGLGYEPGSDAVHPG